MTCTQSRLSSMVAIALAVPLCAVRPSAVEAAGVCPATQQNDPIVLHAAAPAYRPARFARTTLNVSLSREGLVRLVTVGRSSGNAKFDAANVAAVKATAFAPAARSCIAVDGVFRYTITANQGNTVAMAVDAHSTNVSISQNR